MLWKWETIKYNTHFSLKNGCDKPQLFLVYVPPGLGSVWPCFASFPQCWACHCILLCHFLVKTRDIVCIQWSSQIVSHLSLRIWRHFEFPTFSGPTHDGQFSLRRKFKCDFFSNFGKRHHFCTWFSVKFKCQINEPTVLHYWFFFFPTCQKLKFCKSLNYLLQMIIKVENCVESRKVFVISRDFLLDILRLMLLEPFPVKMPSLVQLK